jgi:hypothetical protein
VQSTAKKTRAGSIASAARVEALEGRQLFAAGVSSVREMVGAAGLFADATMVASAPAVSLTVAPSATAAVTATLYDSAGFEPPRFTTGNLGGQDAPQGTWVKSGNAAAAVVQTAVVANGLQAVRLDRTNGLDARFAPTLAAPSVTDPITISWVMRVEASAGAQPFGPFFGVEAYHDAGNGVLRLIGTGGMDAKTGEVLFQHAGTGFLDATDVTVSFGQFHTFRLVLDYAQQEYSLYVDEALIRTEGFVDGTAAAPITGFSIASLSTFAASGDSASQAASGTAYFDDYKATSGSVVAAPQVSSFTVDDGTAQRSKVRSLTVMFDRPVTLSPGALSLSRHNTGGSGANDGSAPTDASGVLGVPTSSDGGTTWVVTFNGTAPFAELKSDGTPTGSLVDGIYTLSVDPTKVTAGGVAMTSPASMTFHRLFGDFNGSKSIQALDYNAFRNAFGKGTGQTGFDASFDFDNSGTVNALDFNQFRSRFGKVFTY